MWITIEFVDFFQPTIRVGLYVLRVVWQSPHLCKLLKTNARYADKGEVGGSSPPRPTIQITSKYAAILTFPSRGISVKKPICQLFANFRIDRMALHSVR
jgi:hypothetical protein